MTVSLWRRNLKSSILLALSVMLLLPYVPVMALEEAIPVSVNPTTAELSVPVIDSVSTEPMPENELAAEEVVSSVATVPHEADTSDTNETIVELADESAMSAKAPEPLKVATHTEPSPIKPKDPIVISAVQISNGVVDFVQLLNIDEEIVSALDLSLVLTYHPSLPQDNPVQCKVAIDGYVLPDRHLVIAGEKVSGNNVYPLGVCRGVSSGAITIELRRTQQVHPTVNPDGTIERIHFDGMGLAQSKQWTRRGFTGAKLTGELDTDFLAGSPSLLLAADALYVAPSSPPLTITEILPSPNDCPLNDNRLSCRPYVKVINDSNAPVDLASYRLRSGAVGETASKYNTSDLSGKVAPNSFAILYQDKKGGRLALDKSAGTVWFEDSYGVTVYENSIAPYEKADTAAWKAKAWAYDESDKTWKWGAASPATRQTDFTIIKPSGFGGASEPALVPCRDDQFRNPLTNRCNALESTSTTLQPCTSGQYRNPDTNRCNNLASTVSTLKACEADEFRNPATNRCNKLASTTSTLQPCEAGFERNPETNRCRKTSVAGSSSAKLDFPVQEVQDGTKAFVGWWALGGLLILGAGYASWEWRRELAGAIKSIGIKFSSSKGK